MRILLSVALFWCLTLKVSGNNLQLDSLELRDSITVSMMISWDNSWNRSDSVPFNHDAAWVFLKYKSGNTWKHANVSSSLADHTANENYIQVTPGSDNKGVFISFSDQRDGTLSARIELKLEEALAPGSYDLRAFGIEMVLVQEGAFYLGDSLSNNSFRTAAANGPFRISSENEIAVGSSSGMMDNTITYPPAANIPSSYPKGYSSFYIMKYEISQDQYAGFLNTLSYTQQAARTAIPPSSSAGSFAMTSTMVQTNRNGIVIKVPGNSGNPAIYSVNADNDGSFGELNDGGNRAANFLSWQDLVSYLDWACLRPITEPEYEKACRGPVYPTPLEFPWGTVNVADANTITYDGEPGETVAEKGNQSTGVASHGYAGPQGPMRCGFNGSQTSTRTESGSSFYGCKELSGNLWEQCVSVNASALQFTGIHGDGEVSSAGLANVAGWDNSGNSTGIRGGGWNSGIQPGFRDLAVSDRFYGTFNTSTRRNTTGGRGGRKL